MKTFDEFRAGITKRAEHLRASRKAQKKELELPVVHIEVAEDDDVR